MDSIRQLKAAGAFEKPPRFPSEYTEARSHYLAIVPKVDEDKRNPFANELLYELQLEIMVERVTNHLQRSYPGKDWEAEMTKAYTVEHQSHQDILRAFTEQPFKGDEFEELKKDTLATLEGQPLVQQELPIESENPAPPEEVEDDIPDEKIFKAPAPEPAVEVKAAEHVPAPVTRDPYRAILHKLSAQWIDMAKPEEVKSQIKDLLREYDLDLDALEIHELKATIKLQREP